jgi:glycosyltransferase involved in cell wall biosynthesis
VRSVSVVVPVYNSEASLEPLVERLSAVIAAQDWEAEVILVNDGSRDASWEKVKTLSARYPWVFGINLMRNYGQHNALLCGIRAASHEFVVTIDDDLQHPPEEIPLLFRELDQGFDVVYGTPLEEQHGFWRDLASQITKWALQNAMGARTARKVSAFRVFRTQLRAGFARYQGSFVSVDVMLTWATTRFSSVGVRHDVRRHGVSNYTLTKLVNHAVNMMTGFSVLPLQLASMVGFAMTLFGIAILGYVVIRYVISGHPVPGFTFLASVISIFSGTQMFAIGIMGEYLARIHFRTLDRPAYAIREQTAAFDTGSASRNGTSFAVAAGTMK